MDNVRLTTTQVISELQTIITHFVLPEHQDAYMSAGPNKLQTLLLSDANSNVGTLHGKQRETDLKRDIKAFVKLYIRAIRGLDNVEFELELYRAIGKLPFITGDIHVSIERYIHQIEEERLARTADAQQLYQFSRTPPREIAHELLRLSNIAPSVATKFRPPLARDDMVFIGSQLGQIWCVSNGMAAVQFQTGTRAIVNGNDLTRA